MNATFVIIGGGISGVSCAKSLNFLAPNEKIILITSNSLVKVITNIIPLGKMSMQFNVEQYDSEKLLSDNSSLKLINDTVIKIDTKQKIIKTSGDKTIKFKKLCICTGAKPRLIAEENPHVIGIRDTESVEEFSRRISKSKKILIVGNGGIATEIVYKLQNIEIIWVIKDNHMSATFVDAGAAEFLKNKLLKDESKTENPKICKRLKYSVSRMEKSSADATGAALGPDWHEMFTARGAENKKSEVQIEYNCEVKRIMNPDEVKCEKWPIYAELTNNKIIGCDLIVSAIGVSPNTQISGLENLEKAEDGGFLVNWKLETSSEDIYAAGDVCSANWDLAEHWFQMRLWTQAHQMGCYAAKSMISTLRNEYFLQDFCFELFTHVTKFFGYKIVLLGLYNGQKLSNNYEILLRYTKNEEYIKLILKNGKLQGAVLIGDTDLEEMCENLILNQLDISIYGEDLLNPDIDIDDYFD